jgi:hypothetical protein
MERAGALLMNAMIVENFGIRAGKIHGVEAMPFITIPYGLATAGLRALAGKPA